MRNQNVHKVHAHAEGTMWYVPTYANVVVKAKKSTNVTQPMIGGISI